MTQDEEHEVPEKKYCVKIIKHLGNERFRRPSDER